MDEARKLLDSLMGPSRNKSHEEQQRADAWKDVNVCKRFLVGFCPNQGEDNWFKNTRRDPGTCCKIHSELLRAQYENHPDKSRYAVEYEREFLHFLEGLIFEADSWIGREKVNCKPAGKVMRMPPHVEQSLASMQEESEALMRKAEDLAEESKLEPSKEAFVRAQDLRKEIDDIKEKYTFMSRGEEVCEVCGIRCNPDDQEHYRAHFEGKLHAGYLRIREKVKHLRTKRDETSQPEEDKPRDRRKEGRQLDRSRDRTRDRNGDRSRKRGRDRGS